MNKYILTIITAIVAVAAWAQQSETYFAYPTPPDNLPFGRQRANYMVEHFWDRTPWKTAYTSPQGMEGALRDFAEFISLAAPDTVHLSIDKLIKESIKKPANFSALMTMAEAVFHSDTAVILSREVYLPFVEKAAGYKKFSAEQRNYYAHQLKVIKSSATGATLPAIEVVNRDGERFALNDTTSGAQTYVLILERTDDFNAMFERVHFVANAAVGELVSSGLLKPMLVAIGEVSDSWWQSVANLPEQWSVGYLADADEYFDLRTNPAVYVLSSEMEVVSEWMPLSALITNCETLVKSMHSYR